MKKNQKILDKCVVCTERKQKAKYHGKHIQVNEPFEICEVDILEYDQK